MQKYHLRYVHKVAPSEKDVAIAELPDTAFADPKTLAKALRKAGLMASGARIREMRTEVDREGTRVVVFPTLPGLSTYWHAIVIRPL